MDDCTPYIGYQFNEFYGCMEFIKITTNNELENYNHPLTTGYNEIPFTDTRGYISGGMKFIESENMFQHINSTHMATYLRYLEIPDEANVVVKSDGYMADKLILSERQLISDMDIWNHPDVYKKHLITYPKLAKYIKNIPSELALQLLDKDLSTIEHIENPTEEMCIKAVSQQPHLIYKIKNATMNVYKALIKKSAYAINYITPIDTNTMLELVEYSPEILKYVTSHDDVKEMVVSKNGSYLQYITNKTKKICDLAYKNTPEAIQHIPNNLKTYDMCMLAVAHDYQLFSHVPQKFMNNDLCLYVLIRDPHLISKIHEPTDEMYLECSKTIPALLGKINNKTLIKDVDPLEIIKIDPTHLKNISEPTYEMCFEAVSKNGKLLDIVPDELLDENICLAGVKTDGNVLQYIPELFQTENVCTTALKNCTESFKYIKNKTNKIIEFVLNLNYYLINHIQDIITDIDFLYRMKLLCASKCGLSLQFIKNPTHQMCAYAVEQNYKALKFVPRHLLDDDLLDCALLKNGKAIKYISDQTKIMCEEAVENNPLAIKHVNEKFLTEELCINAIREDYKALGKIKNQTIEMCLIAVRINERAIKYVRDLDGEKCCHLWCLNPKIIDHIDIPFLKNACINIEQEFIATFVF